jgi:hypothetical protein
VSRRWVILCPVVAALVFALFSVAFHVGYAMSARDTIADNVNMAAIAASRLQFDPANPEAFSSAVKNLVVYGSSRARRNRLVDGLTPEDVRVIWLADRSGRPTKVTVQVVGASTGSLLQAMLLTRRPEATIAWKG